MAHIPKPLRKKNKAARNRGNVFFGEGPSKIALPAGTTLIDLGKPAHVPGPVFLDPFEIHKFKTSEESRRTLDARIRRGRQIRKGSDH